MRYNPNEFDKYMEDARFKAEQDSIELVGTVNTSEDDGYAIVKGVSSAYKVGYKLDNDNNMYGYDCTCPHNYYRSLPCKHMYVAERDLDNFTIVR